MAKHHNSQFRCQMFKGKVRIDWSNHQQMMISKLLLFPWKPLTAEQVIFTHERFRLCLRWHFARRKKGGAHQKCWFSFWLYLLTLTWWQMEHTESFIAQKYFVLLHRMHSVPPITIQTQCTYWHHTRQLKADFKATAPSWGSHSPLHPFVFNFKKHHCLLILKTRIFLRFRHIHESAHLVIDHKKWRTSTVGRNKGVVTGFCIKSHYPPNL